MYKNFYVPIITPFDEKGNIDYDGLYYLTKCLIKEGAEGIYAGGSSAEFPLLSEEERKMTLETIIAAASEEGGKVIAHIGCPGLRQAMILAEHAHSAGAHMISSVAPYYFMYSFEEVKYYYKELAHATDLEMMVYNMPHYTKTALSPEQLSELVQDSKINSIKYTDGNMFALERLKRLSDVKVYSGSDEIFLSSLSMGADGAIGTTFNFMLEKYAAIKRHFDNGDIHAARDIQNQANDITSLVVSTKLLPATKYLMELKGMPVKEYSRSPIRNLTNEEKLILRNVYNEKMAQPSIVHAKAI